MLTTKEIIANTKALKTEISVKYKFDFEKLTTRELKSFDKRLHNIFSGDTDLIDMDEMYADPSEDVLKIATFSQDDADDNGDSRIEVARILKKLKSLGYEDISDDFKDNYQDMVNGYIYLNHEY